MSEYDDAAWIEDIDPVQKDSTKKKKIEYVWMVLQCEEYAVAAFIKKHSKSLNSPYWYSSHLIARVLYQADI